MGGWAAASNDVADLKGGTWTLDRKHSNVSAKVLHMGVSLYVVRFNAMEATLIYDPAHPEATHVEASVDTASFDVNADYGARFAEEFLAARANPKMTFVSTEVRRGEGGHGTMTGNLTLRGVTKPVVFDVTFNGTGRSMAPPFATVAGFSATAHIKRSDFGSTAWNNGVVADDVAISIEAEFDRK